MLIAIVDLPEKCSCGSEKGMVIKGGIEGSRGQLLAEVECSKCRKRALIPDKKEEELRKIAGEKYRPTWYYHSGTGEIAHWSKKSKMKMKF